jgi:hypothetical protein
MRANIRDLPGLRAVWGSNINPSAFRSFGMNVERYVSATCEEIDCPHWTNGWAATAIPGSEDWGLIIAACEGRVDDRRRMPASREVLPDGMVRLWFPPGQPCFKASTHRVPWSARWYHRDGDIRGNPSGLVVAHADARSWVDEFGEHQMRLAEQHRRYGSGR